MRISDWSSDVCSSDLQPAIESPLNTHCPVSVPIDETQHMRPQRPLRIKALFLPGELYRNFAQRVDLSNLFRKGAATQIGKARILVQCLVKALGRFFGENAVAIPGKLGREQTQLQ